MSLKSLLERADAESVSLSRYERMGPEALAVQDHVSQLQDEALDDVVPWLDALPIDNAIRWKIFDQFSILTGQLLNRVIDKTKDPRRLDASRFAVIDCAASLQDEVLEDGQAWLQELPVGEDVRSNVFDEMCFVTGGLLNRVFEPAPY